HRRCLSRELDQSSGMSLVFCWMADWTHLREADMWLTAFGQRWLQYCGLGRSKTACGAPLDSVTTRTLQPAWQAAGQAFFMARKPFPYGGGQRCAASTWSSHCLID